MDKRFLGILTAIILVFVGVFVVSQGSSNNTNSQNTTLHLAGKGSKGVTLQEYGDYECSACYGYYQPLKTAIAQMDNDVYFQFSNLPLSQIHKNAISSARAAEAASLQDKYWEMHDILYENQDPTGATGWVTSTNPLEDYYIKFATTIGLNLAQFRQDYASSKVNDSINADLAAFNKTGQAKATPTFFLDGKYVDNSNFLDESGKVSVDKIVKLLTDAIKSKSQ